MPETSATVMSFRSTILMEMGMAVDQSDRKALLNWMDMRSMNAEYRGAGGVLARGGFEENDKVLP